MTKNKVIEFLEKYRNYYPEFEPIHIREKIKYGFHSDTDQIICHLGLIDIENSAYFKFFEIIKSEFDLQNKKIFEASCGLIPVLSSIIEKYTSSTCTAIDKKILFHNYKNIKTKELNIDDNIDLVEYDLIIGFRCCSATDPIINNCFKYNKNFAIYLCPCNHLNNDPYVPNQLNAWHKLLINKIKSNKQYDVKIITNHNLQDSLPIVIAKKK